MEFRTIEILSFKQTEQIEFYRDLIGFDIKPEYSGFSIKCGITELIFRKTDGRDNFYHFACLICEEHFTDCLQFIKQKGIEILPDKETGDEITLWGNNTGRSFYFFDPDNNIVEFVTRPSLPYTSNTDWSLNEIIKINEIGTPVENVIETATELLKATQIVIPDFVEKRFHDQFCWFGDYEGAILIVKITREWYPTNIRARTSDLRLKIKQEDELIDLEFINGEFKMCHNNT